MRSASSPPLSSADRRTLVLGVGVVSCILVAGRAVPAWRTWVDVARAQATELQGEQVQAAAAVRAYPAVRDSARARVERARVATEAMLHAPSSAAAGAMLAERATGAAMSADVRLGSLTLDAVDVRGCRTSSRASHGDQSRSRSTAWVVPCVWRVRVRTEVTGDAHGFAVFLTLLERGLVHIAVPQLALAQADPAAPPTRPETLRGTITLETLAIADAPDRDPAGGPRRAAASIPKATPPDTP
ncbi:MAG TPA: hypothetical protein VGD56_17085 [Gemmatirosa sp.]